MSVPSTTDVSHKLCLRETHATHARAAADYCDRPQAATVGKFDSLRPIMGSIRGRHQRVLRALVLARLMSSNKIVGGDVAESSSSLNKLAARQPAAPLRCRYARRAHSDLSRQTHLAAPVRMRRPLESAELVFGRFFRSTVLSIYDEQTSNRAIKLKRFVRRRHSYWRPLSCCCRRAVCWRPIPRRCEFAP